MSSPKPCSIPYLRIALFERGILRLQDMRLLQRRL